MAVSRDEMRRNDYELSYVSKSHRITIAERV